MMLWLDDDKHLIREAQAATSVPLHTRRRRDRERTLLHCRRGRPIIVSKYQQVTLPASLPAHVQRTVHTMPSRAMQQRCMPELTCMGHKTAAHEADLVESQLHLAAG